MARRGSNKPQAKSQTVERKSTRNEVPDVYKEMLADAVSSSSIRTSEEGRALKRRRVGERVVKQGQDNSAHEQSAGSSRAGSDTGPDAPLEDSVMVHQNIVESESEDSANSDLEWEEVNFRNTEYEGQELKLEDGKSEGLSLILGGGDVQAASRQRNTKRKPLTAAEKKLRLEIHKMHLCALLVHTYIRSHWCNDEKIQSALKKILTRKTISYLNPDETKSQFQRSRSFMDGLEQASDAFRGRFQITARGMSKSFWADSSNRLVQTQPPKDIDLPMQKEDFVCVARELKASRDVGVQLFCALLRSAGVDTRLVCSLQPLTFRLSPEVMPQQNNYAATFSPDYSSRLDIHEKDSGDDKSVDETSIAEPAINSNVADGHYNPKNTATPEASSGSSVLSKAPRRTIRESKYPVYWVEAFNEAVQKWIPVDPLVTKTISKPSKFEPPSGERENNLSYVVAFEDDGSARDVTRRYAKAYNAKTRRNRIEVIEGGGTWWRRVMRVYKRAYDLDCDQVEDAELAAKEAAEPMPRNVQDFKDHPYYALERHLRRREVIYPKREVGKVNAGKAANTTGVEPIYRRRDVHVVQSADKWYRVGREIKSGEQPLKRVAPRQIRGSSVDVDDANADEGENAGTALYAVHQTTLYRAPPTVNGRIPRNMYGNLDIYVPSMVPSGASHVQHPEAARAAKILGIDFADAVTGFSFKGRHGTAVINGAVLAQEYREAVQEVIVAFEDERARAEEERRSQQAIRMWKRFFAGLRIRERIDGYDIEGERGAMNQEADTSHEEFADDDGGGFFPDQDTAGVAEPTVETPFDRGPTYATGHADGGFTVDGTEEVEDGTSDRRVSDRFIDNFEEDDGGGFLIDDNQGKADESALAPIDNFQACQIVQTELDMAHGTSDIDSLQSPVKRELPHIAIRDENTDKVILDHEDGGDSMRENENPRDEENVFDHSNINEEPQLTDNELAEARMLQQIYETGGTGSFLAPKAKEAVEPPLMGRPSELFTKNPGTNPEETSSTPREAAPTLLDSEDMRSEAKADSDNSEEDKGSLLSQDPDEEDAEPEWLA